MDLRDFVHVEFARAWQEEQGAARVDPEAAAATRRDPALPDPSDPAGRLLLYARTLIRLRLDAGDGEATVRALAGGLTAANVLVPFVGALAGAAMLQAALPPNDVRPVNVFQLVAEGVLLPGLFLVWTLALTRLLARHVGSLHWVAWGLGLLRRRSAQTQAGRLAGRVARRSGVAAALFASFSHLFWIAALAVFLGLGFWRFAFADYVFAWSSTLPITGDGVQTLFATLARPVEWLPGIAAPDAEQIRISEFGSLSLSGGSGGAYVQSTGDLLRDQELRKGWWGLLLTIVAVWGLLPRLGALVLGRLAIRRGVLRALQDPTSKLILDALAPVLAAPLGAPEQHPRAEAPPTGTAPMASLGDRAGRGLDLVVFATETPDPATLATLRLDRLGLSGEVRVVPEDDDDDAMDAIVAALAGPAAPEGAVVVFPFGGIPDGLKQDFLARGVLALGADAPAHVLLIGVRTFLVGTRGSSAPARRDAWIGLAATAGVPAARVHFDAELP